MEENMFSQEKGNFKLSLSEVVTCYTKLVPAFTYTCGPFPPVTASLEEGHQPRPLPRAVGGWGGGGGGPSSLPLSAKPTGGKKVTMEGHC